MLSSFGMDFALKFGGEDQKNKKRSSSQSLRVLDHVHSIWLLFHRKKVFVVTCFGAKVCWSSCASTKVYSRSGCTSSDVGGTA